MLFTRKIDPRCAYCKYGEVLDEYQVICTKKGIVSPAGSCRRFSYDPLKRVPPKPVAPHFSQFSEADFDL